MLVNDMQAPSVAYAQGRFLVTWTDGPWDQLSLYARRYRSGTGAPLEPVPFALGSSVRHF